MSKIAVCIQTQFDENFDEMKNKTCLYPSFTGFFAINWGLHYSLNQIKYLFFFSQPFRCCDEGTCSYSTWWRCHCIQQTWGWRILSYQRSSKFRRRNVNKQLNKIFFIGSYTRNSNSYSQQLCTSLTKILVVFSIL